MTSSSGIFTALRALAQACEELIRRLDHERQSVVFGVLVDNYERDNASNWKDAYVTKWRWFRNQVSDLANQPTIALNALYWNEWLNNKAAAQGWSLFFLVSIPGQ